MVVREELSEARAALEAMCSQATSSTEQSSERIAALELQVQELQYINGSLLHSVEQRLDTDTGAGEWQAGWGGRLLQGAAVSPSTDRTMGGCMHPIHPIPLHAAIKVRLEALPTWCMVHAMWHASSIARSECYLAAGQHCAYALGSAPAALILKSSCST